MKSNDGSGSTANLMVRTESSSSVTFSGVTTTPAVSKEVQFQRIYYDGKRGQQQLWKIYLDANAAPIGVAIGNELFSYKGCLTITSATSIPATSNASGILATGLNNGTSSSLGNNCSTSGTSTANVEWSVVNGSPNPYFCLTMPDSFYGQKTQICFAVDSTGGLTNFAWIRLFGLDRITPAMDYRSVGNVQIDPPAGPVNENNYFYGKVWRPSDGFVYASYPDTKFATRIACENQTVVNWQATYQASNQAWTCVNAIKG